MAWAETCKMDAVAQINKRKEFTGSLRNALRELSKESDIPYGTLKRWYYPESVPNNGNMPPKSSVEKETSTIINLHTMQFDSGRKKIVFGLLETEGNRFLAMQEYRVGQKDKETPTKNRLILSVDLISQFRSALEQVEVLIQERCSGESGAVGSDHKKDDEVEPPAGDAGDLAQDNAVDPNGEDTELSPAPADGAEDTSVEAELVQCADCAHFAVQTWAPEENGACNARSGSWNGKVFQPPHEPHPCPNFQEGQPR